MNDARSSRCKYKTRKETRYYYFKPIEKHKIYCEPTFSFPSYHSQQQKKPNIFER